MDNPAADLPTCADGKLDMGGLIGQCGFLTVSRDLGQREPYIGSVALVSGAPEELTGRLEENITRMDQLTTILDEDGDEAVTAKILRGLEPRVLFTETKEGRDYMPLPAKNGRNAFARPAANVTTS